MPNVYVPFRSIPFVRFRSDNVLQFSKSGIICGFEMCRHSMLAQAALHANLNVCVRDCAYSLAQIMPGVSANNSGC